MPSSSFSYIQDHVLNRITNAARRLRLDGSGYCHSRRRHCRTGHYARNNHDLNAIIGHWHSGLENVYMACGYSGHGIMQAPASGLALSELILDGHFATMDLSAFGYHRIAANRPYREKGIV